MPTINGKACVANGKNLLLDYQTQTKDGSWLIKNNGWTPEQGTYLGSNIFRTNAQFNNAKYSYKDLLDRGVINTTDDFTYSIYFRVVGEDPAGMSYANIYFYSTATTKHAYKALQLNSLKDGQWVRIVVPFKFNGAKYDPTNPYVQSIRVEVSSATQVAGAYYEFAAPKLEKGSVATPLTPAPVDKVFSNGNQVYGRNMIVRTGELVGQMVGTDGSIMPLTEASVTPAIISVKAGEQLTMSGTAAISGPVTDYDAFRYAFYDAVGETLMRSFAYLKSATTKPVIAPTGAATFRISYPTKAQVKLERGNMATDWTPAPEDILN